MIDALSDVWRRETPHVLSALVRRFGDIDACEDAVQEALWEASQAWPVNGVPERPRGWLITVAGRRLVDQRRSDSARRAREQRAARADPLPAGGHGLAGRDDSLAVLLWCCHPALSRPAQTALTLRAVAGLSTRQIAAAHLLPEATVTQRITRAKRTLAGLAVTFAAPSTADLPARVAVVIDVLTVMFAEGHTSSAGGDLVDVDLSAEAVRLARYLHRALPRHDEASAALAWMLLTHARSPARVDALGDLIPLSTQNRRAWDQSMISEGIAIVERVLPHGPVGPYQLRAAIAAVHADAPDWAATDWAQIVELYRMLDALAPDPLVTLNRAVAEAMLNGPRDGLVRLESVADDPRMITHHRFYAVRAHLHEMSGDQDKAQADYRTAARLTHSAPEQRYLNTRAAASSMTAAPTASDVRPAHSAATPDAAGTSGRSRTHPRRGQVGQDEG